jgi:hypothetical protein
MLQIYNICGAGEMLVENICQTLAGIKNNTFFVRQLKNITQCR